MSNLSVTPSTDQAREGTIHQLGEFGSVLMEIGFSRTRAAVSRAERWRFPVHGRRSQCGQRV